MAILIYCSGKVWSSAFEKGHSNKFGCLDNQLQNGHTQVILKCEIPVRDLLNQKPHNNPNISNIYLTWSAFFSMDFRGALERQNSLPALSVLQVLCSQSWTSNKMETRITGGPMSNHSYAHIDDFSPEIHNPSGMWCLLSFWHSRCLANASVFPSCVGTGIVSHSSSHCPASLHFLFLKIKLSGVMICFRSG